MHDLPVGDQMMLLSSPQGEVAERVLLAVPVEQLPGSAPASLARSRPCRLGGPQEHVRGSDQRDQAERAGQQAEEIAACPSGPNWTGPEKPTSS